MTVFEQIKKLDISEMATLIAQMIDHDIDPCSCPIGACNKDCQNEGFCGYAEKSCDESALAWLKSEDELFIDVPQYLWPDHYKKGDLITCSGPAAIREKLAELGALGYEATVWNTDEFIIIITSTPEDNK